MVVEYVGTAYAGFQRQDNGDTVQAVLERAIGRVTGETVTLAAAGRTDAGAHACRQTAAFETGSPLTSGALRDALNAYLPRDIAVIEAEDVPDTFNPRYNATSRTYSYLILNRRVRSPFFEQRAWHVRQPLDVSLMHQAARTLVGEIDLGAFVPVRKEGTKVRRVFDASCRRDGDIVRVDIQASGFMKQMARAIVGTLVDVGLRKIDLDGFRAIVAAHDRLRAAPTAPAHGLYLVNVDYNTVMHHHSPGQTVPDAIEEKG